MQFGQGSGGWAPHFDFLDRHYTSATSHGEGNGCTCRHAVRDLENFCFFDAGSDSASSECPFEFSADLGIVSVAAKAVDPMPLFPGAVCEVR
jgi:hypothetical protein